MAKILKHKGSSMSLEMSASQKISSFMDDNHPHVDTVTFKANQRIIGMKEDNSTATFVKAALGTLRNGSSGSFSVKLPLETGIQYEKQLIEALDCVHKSLDFILTVAYERLSDEDKKMGEKIAEQNILRNELLKLCQARAHASEDVDAFLSYSGLLTIPKCIQLESTLVSGTRLFTDPGTPEYKDGIDSEGNPTWVKNGEIFGRKRVPLRTEESVNMAFEEIASLAANWEGFWSDRRLVSADQIMRDFHEWALALPHQDHEIKIYKLDDDKAEEIRRKAAELYREM